MKYTKEQRLLHSPKLTVNFHTIKLAVWESLPIFFSYG